MNTDNLVVYKSNAVIEAGYQLSLNEQRVVLAAIGLVDPRKNLSVDDKFILSAKDFCTLFDVSEKNAYKALIDVSERLFSRYVVIEKPDADWDKLKTHWISSIRYNKSSGKIAISFASDIIPYLTQLKGSFTRYELKHIGNMTSTYGVRLYELLMQWKNKGSREVEIAWLKKQFQIEDKYNSIKDLKKYVIEPAIKDINTHSNLTVSWEQRKTGRAVTHLLFTFSEKPLTQEEWLEERQAECRKMDREIIEDFSPPYKFTDEDYEDMGYELMSKPPADTPPEPPKPHATIALTDEQLKCFEWAKNHDHWKKYTGNKKSFLTCFNSIVEGGLKDQWLATKTAVPVSELIGKIGIEIKTATEKAALDKKAMYQKAFNDFLLLPEPQQEELKQAFFEQSDLTIKAKIKDAQRKQTDIFTSPLVMSPFKVFLIERGF